MAFFGQDAARDPRPEAAYAVSRWPTGRTGA